MAARKRQGHEGRVQPWTWCDRGRSACTPESIRADIAALRAWVSYRLVLDGLVRLQ